MREYLFEAFSKGRWQWEMEESIPYAKRVVGLIPLDVAPEFFQDHAAIVNLIQEKVDKGVQNFLMKKQATLITPTVWWGIMELDAKEQASFHCSHLVRFIGYAREEKLG